ncbi:UNVERIFIED_ORG: hypothetical protein M2438_000874 [Methylobacterium sp. SuP10 SLI 274]|nr:hypothetical protein [Methylorubrum extorquens]MDF9790378.1 hypothetical protein [Methylorubrum extorquens]MDF9862083.1 hypothetical protein [Methylorubrum pseudosasae]MDH6635699.1 hypothetical protein [Methylobacterium sp. SuP10 SLI 274]MDH6664875.1 hypothetical protein [Methylorubrum zatmanii]
MTPMIRPSTTNGNLEGAAANSARRFHALCLPLWVQRWTLPDIAPAPITPGAAA